MWREVVAVADRSRAVGEIRVEGTPEACAKFVAVVRRHLVVTKESPWLRNRHRNTGRGRVYLDVMEPLPPAKGHAARGVCRGCGQDFALNGDGTVRKHDVENRSLSRMVPCEGSRQFPNGAVQ